MGAAALGGNAADLGNKQQQQQSQYTQREAADIRGMAEAAMDVVSMHGDDNAALAKMGVVLEQALKTNDLNQIKRLATGIFDFAKKHRMPTH
jgi:carbamate kinase